MHDSEAFAQRRYQLRFDWGLDGATRVARDADIVVWVDALDSVDASERANALVELLTDGETGTGESDTTGPVILAATLRNRTAAARGILALQEERGRRLTVAVLAADGPSVEDQLAAGAVIDALVSLGIDHTSPEAAFACAGFEGLRRAIVHLTSASGTGVVLRTLGRADEVHAAAQLDVDDHVPTLR